MGRTADAYSVWAFFFSPPVRDKTERRIFMLVLKNCRLIPALTEGFDLPSADLVLDGELIADIRPAGGSYEDVPVLDMAGKTVLPGLFDLHTHLHSLSGNLMENQLKDFGTSCFDTCEYANTYLKLGYTTVRDMGSNSRCAIAVRNAVQKGQITGPRIYSAGLMISPKDAGNDAFSLMYNEADGREAVIGAVREEIAHGCDFVKYMVSGAFLNEGSVPGNLITTEEELRAVVDTAAARDKYVAVHCHGTEGIKMSVRAGVHTIEHATLIDEEGVGMLAGSKDTFLVPTIGIFQFLIDLSKADSNDWRAVKAKTYLPLLQQSLRAAYKAGLKFGWGTDLDMGSYVENPAQEFLVRRDLIGISNIDLLRQATINSAEIIGAADMTGSVKAGKYADLVVVDGNPDEDISVMGKPRAHVFKGGVHVAG